MNKSEKPRLINCQKGHRQDIYEVLQKDSKIFSNKDLKDIFMMALCIGYIHKTRLPISKKDFLFRTDQLPDNSEDYWIFKAIVVSSERNMDILLDEKQICEIAEEYANAGITLLKDNVLQSDDYADFSKRLESELRDILKNSLKK